MIIKYKTILLLLAITLFVSSCRWMITDDDKTKCIYSSAFEGSMSVDLFEVKKDRTFRHYAVYFGSTKNIEGRWYYKDDTVILHKHKDSTLTYGKVFLKFDTASANQADTIPYFSLSGKDTLSLKDLTYSNVRNHLRYHNPPKDIFFKIHRDKANRKIKDR